MDEQVIKFLNENLKDNLLYKNGDYVLRPFHVEILKSMFEKFKVKESFLCQMTPGSGRTTLLLAAVKLFLFSGLGKKVLIIIDSLSYQKQINHAFYEFLPEIEVANFNKEANKNIECPIYISTANMLLRDNKYLNNFKDNFFDLIVYFDLNRQINGKLKDLGNYFKGIKLGILDTPYEINKFNVSRFNNKHLRDTYELFGKKLGELDYKYSMVDAVNEGYLPNPIIRDKEISIDEDIFKEIFKRINKIKYSSPNTKLEDDILDIEFLIRNICDNSKENKIFVEELLKRNLTENDIEDIRYKKEQLEEFELLLKDEHYFRSIEQKKGSTEKVWQDFFELNCWIFGYGLTFIFTNSLKDNKLEQVVSGYNFNTFGKRVDGLLYTNGIINSLVFVEVKCHNTKLLCSKPYRSGCWPISSELIGALSQIQKTVQKATNSIQTKTDIITKNGDPTGEVVFLYNPKSFIVVGNLNEFCTEKGINEDKFASFELFRRNVSNTDIITYDELFNRAKHILESRK